MTSPAEPTTLFQALEAAAGGGRGAVFHLEGGPRRVEAGELVERARRGAAALAERGVGPGDPVGLLGPNHPDWVRWAASVWAAGAVLVPLAYPLRIRDGRGFAGQVRAVARAAGCRAVVCHPRFREAVPPELALPWDLPAARSGGRAPAPDPGDPAVVQFTSGSTAFPKGAVLSHRAVLAAVRSLARRQRIDPGEDRLLSWVPFFHDLGLFGYVVRPLVLGAEAHVLPTESFARDPALWLRLVGPVGATITSGPASAWGAAARAAARDPEGIDLSSVRLGTFSAEAIDPAVVDRVLEVGGPLGLRGEALAGAYGLAEATLGVTATEPGAGLRMDRVDLPALAASGRAVPPRGRRVKRVASCGPPLPGMEVRVMGPDGPLPDRRVGEVLVRGPSVMSGYVGAGPHVPDPFLDGWLQTGDLGYLADGELFVTGRAKDVVIVLGHNYPAEDLEWAAGAVSGVRPGRCVAFSPPGGPEGYVVVAVEPSGEEGVDGLPLRVRAAVERSVGLTPREVVVLPRGTIPKTTSGKLRRAAVREAHGRGDLAAAALARWPGPPRGAAEPRPAARVTGRAP